jgi:hypothetical protein
VDSGVSPLDVRGVEDDVDDAVGELLEVDLVGDPVGSLLASELADKGPPPIGTCSDGKLFEHPLSNINENAATVRILKFFIDIPFIDSYRDYGFL